MIVWIDRVEGGYQAHLVWIHASDTGDQIMHGSSTGAGATPGDAVNNIFVGESVLHGALGKKDGQDGR